MTKSFELDDLILLSDIGCMKEPDADESLWQKTQYANLIRYKPSKKYFARIRINGKLIRRSLKTGVLSVAKLRLGDLEKKERQLAEHQTAAADGRMSFGDALAIYEQRLKGDASLKPRTREYHQQRINALLRSWPELKQTELRNITKSDCLNWSPTFSQGRSPTAFNHTVGILRQILEIGVESGVRYDNPARFVKRLSERSEKPHLPEINQFFQINGPEWIPFESRALAQAMQQSPPSKDPCNPKAFQGWSYLELPDAPAQPWIEEHAGTPKGKVTKTTFKSAILIRYGLRRNLGCSPAHSRPVPDFTWSSIWRLDDMKPLSLSAWFMRPGASGMFWSPRAIR